MNYYQSPAAVIDLPEADRATFIRRTYAHLAGALLAFAALEYIFLSTPIAQTLASVMMGGRWSWLIVLGAFMLVSHVATSWASSAVSRQTQYGGLALYVVAEAIIFAPLLFFVTRFDAMILPKASLITTGLFLGLTWVAFTTKKDFTFLQGILKVGGFVALGTIVASIAFGFNLGIIFSSLMLLLLGGSVLYQTSNIIHHYRTNQDVAASLALFASFATMLWYVIRILIQISASSRN
jgi:FtsH-binding integral membrane protein